MQRRRMFLVMVLALLLSACGTSTTTNHTPTPAPTATMTIPSHPQVFTLDTKGPVLPHGSAAAWDRNTSIPAR